MDEKNISALSTVDPQSREIADYLGDGFASAIQSWAESKSDPKSVRYDDLVRDKSRVVGDFFVYVQKPPDQVTPADINSYRRLLKKRGLAKSTIYSSISRISSFYTWLMQTPELLQRIKLNPVSMARPKSPKAYQGERTKSLSDEDVQKILSVVKNKADSGDVIGLRDYALLLLYFVTGMRRQEIISLRYNDIILGSIMIVSNRVKGGDLVTREIEEPNAQKAVLDYLIASERLKDMKPESPLWVAHDNGSVTRKDILPARERGKEIQLTSHGFVKNLKSYARQAGIDHIHLHQTRHTYARIVSEETGSMADTQEALGHKNAATTRVYVNRLTLKKDKTSRKIARRLKLED